MIDVFVGLELFGQVTDGGPYGVDGSGFCLA